MSKKQADPIFVFVYGTLKRGHQRHSALSNSPLIAQETIKGTLLNLGNFPGFIPEGNEDVHGEIYEITPQILSLLDRIEGHPDFYKRQLIATEHQHMHQKDVWVYCLPESYLQEANYKRIPSGIWEGV